jgi:hypothetical protein
MNAFSPIHSYALGAASVGLGLHAFFRPRQEYARFGLPLEPSPPPAVITTTTTTTHPGPTVKDTTDVQATGEGGGSASPLIYLKGVREVTYGVALMTLQHQDNAAGVTTVAGVMALAAVGDGLLVWFYGGGLGGRSRSRSRGNNETKAWGHWAAAVGLGSWTAWRAFVAYGEWAAFHALN